VFVEKGFRGIEDAATLAFTMRVVSVRGWLAIPCGPFEFCC
jgi:hypothetical protein